MFFRGLTAEVMQPSYAQDMGTGEVSTVVVLKLYSGVETLTLGPGHPWVLRLHAAGVWLLRRVHRRNPLLPVPQSLQKCATRYILALHTLRSILLTSLRPILPGSVGLVSRFGQFYKAVDPGLVQVNVCTESLRVVDVKIQISPIGRQKVITRDNVDVEMYAILLLFPIPLTRLQPPFYSDSVIYFQITSPYRAAFGITDLRQALIERAQTTLRHVVGARAVQSVVTEREAIAFEIAEIVGDVADKWGVAIEGILIKDIIFSPEVSASLSSAAQQKRIGESKVIAARAEVDAARLMRQAADILASPAAMQIRQLEALQTMAKSANSKVVFVPMQLQSDVVGQVAKHGSGSGGGQAAIDNAVRDESGENLGAVGRAGLLNTVSNI